MARVTLAGVVVPPKEAVSHEAFEETLRPDTAAGDEVTDTDCDAGNAAPAFIENVVVLDDRVSVGAGAACVTVKF